jgi:hypothetical protein
MTDTTPATSNTDAAAVADAARAGVTDPAPIVGIKLDDETAAAIGKTVADAISSPQGQAIESELVAGLPKKARGWIYAGVGALGTAASSVAAYGLTNPGVLPEWLTITAAIVAAPSNAVVGSSALANLGKK